MPKGGHAVTTMSGVSGDGLGFRKENFIGDALRSFFMGAHEISFCQKSPIMNSTFVDKMLNKLRTGARSFLALES